MTHISHAMCNLGALEAARPRHAQCHGSNSQNRH